MLTLTRKLYNFGTIYIPKKIFSELNFSERQQLEIIIEHGVICIKKFNSDNIKDRDYIGIVRTIYPTDQRLCIPKEYLHLMNLIPGEMINMVLDGETIKLLKTT